MKKPSHDYAQLQQIIAGLSEGVILVGTDRRIVWSNDAALAMHGVKRVKDLGETPAEYRRRFKLRYRNSRTLPRGRYPIDRALAGERFEDVTVQMTRICHPERSWMHTWRSLAVTGPTGTLECWALIARDETERYEAEARFESAFNANPAPALICRLSDHRYVRVNPGFLEMTGFSREDVIDTSLGKLDILADAEKRDLAFAKLKEGATIPQMEALIPVPQGGRKFVILAGEPIEIAEEACILFTFADLDPRKKVESSLRQSEERFAKSFRLSPAPSAICTLAKLELIEVNEAFMQMTGFAEDALAGRPAVELSVDRAAFARLEEAVSDAGSVRNIDLQLRAKDGAVIDCLLSADRVTIDDRDCVLCVMQDITERKRSETELIDAIETVMADTSWFSRAIVEKLAALRRASSPRLRGVDLHELTAREREVLGFICQGYGDKEMSASLKLSPNTIRNHVASLYQKISVKRRAAAVIWGRERGVTGSEAPSARATGR